MRYLFLILLLISCKPTKTVVKTERSHDFIYKENTIKLTPPSISLIKIEKPCDSLGDLKPFKTVIKTGKAHITIEGKNNVITAKINLDSIKEGAIKEYRSKFKESTHKEVITKYKIPKWVWWLLGINILYIVYRLRKYIPYLNMLPF